ncbi:hypothetical protein TNCV_3000251 [Trichonephila clavipes]|nr:hypothetical protein TNCV_3000251 [Trichonephila clavipes]
MRNIMYSYTQYHHLKKPSDLFQSDCKETHKFSKSCEFKFWHCTSYSRVGQSRFSLSFLLQWVDKGVPSLLGDLNTGVSLQTDHMNWNSAHAPQRPMVTYTGMATVGPGSHVLLSHLVCSSYKNC